VDYAPSAEPPLPQALKIIIAGGFGAGKTTAVGAISEITPLSTEAVMTTLSIGVDDHGQEENKVTTTVAMDFGRVTIDEHLKLYLFGTPGQSRFRFMWDDLSDGALGAVVIVDGRRLDDCHAAVDYFERANLPLVVAVNAFHGQLARSLDDIRWALTLADNVPVIAFDARARTTVRDCLLVLLDQALTQAYGVSTA
jgi:signal recognition particle receptor subunit beta